MTDRPLIVWFRRDLRLADNPVLAAAVASGQPVLPVFILDPETEAIGRAAKWRLGVAIAAFRTALAKQGLQLILRRGEALAALRILIDETGATAVHWTRAYDAECMARDLCVKSELRAAGIDAKSHSGHVLFEPWTVETGQGGPYRVYTPFWNAVKHRDPGLATPPPSQIRAPSHWPASDDLQDWALGAGMGRGAAVVSAYTCVGEQAALARLDQFCAGPLDAYKTRRDFAAEAGTSRLSENLTYGEIGVRTIWHKAMNALYAGRNDAETFLKELVWREFAYHLMYHFPQIARENWRKDWQGFGWRGDNNDAERWRRGMTGEPFVDAALRELYVTGTMHNRARMIAASYLTKHLLTDWRVGLQWFADCLIDWDPAANAMGWQWVAGCGPDASPFFRIFNPATQAEKFDPNSTYRRRFIAEGSPRPGGEALAFFKAVPRSWGLNPQKPYPKPVIPLAVGREKALAAYADRNTVKSYA